MLVGGTLVALFLFWKCPAYRKWAAIAIGVGICAALLGIAIKETALTIDPVAGIIGGAVAAFGGAYFAFDLQKDSAREDEKRRFRISATEDLQAMWLEGGPFGTREFLNYLFNRSAVQRSEIERLLQRTDSEAIRYSFYKMQQIVDAAREIYSAQMPLYVRADFDRLAQQFDPAQDMFLRAIEQRLLIEYGVLEPPPKEFNIPI